jgi:uncharacterized protein (TIGR02001 family)
MKPLHRKIRDYRLSWRLVLAPRPHAGWVAMVGTGLIWLGALTTSPAQAQSPGAGATGAISLGNRAWSPSEATRPVPSNDGATDKLEFSAQVGLATDYIYRGTTLSDRKPAAGAAIEATYAWLYAGVAVATVKLPTEPFAEITLSSGIRPTLGKINFDLGLTYFLYPSERLPGPTNGIDYREAGARADTQIGESVRVAAGFAYSPNVSNTGAWGWYAAGGIGYDVPQRLLPKDVSISFTGGAGYSWFGNQSAVLGGFPLPDYLNWQAGVTFTRDKLNLDLRYYDTNLSKENCYVFTGDPNAQPGGRIDPITNPAGLVSRWCSAAFVAKVWLAFN